jgi:hypothetical protein
MPPSGASAKAIVTVYGNNICPAGFTTPYTGNIYGQGRADPGVATVSDVCYQTAPGGMQLTAPPSVAFTFVTPVSTCAVCQES